MLAPLLFMVYINDLCNVSNVLELYYLLVTLISSVRIPMLPILELKKITLVLYK